MARFELRRGSQNGSDVGSRDVSPLAALIEVGSVLGPRPAGKDGSGRNSRWFFGACDFGRGLGSSGTVRAHMAHIGRSAEARTPVSWMEDVCRRISAARDRRLAADRTASAALPKAKPPAAGQCR